MGSRREAAELYTDRIQEYARQTAAAAPPLSKEQRDKLAVLLHKNPISEPAKIEVTP